jgi:hypothetical protein
MARAAARALAAPRARRAHAQLHPRRALRPAYAAPHRVCSSPRLASSACRPGPVPPSRAFVAAAGSTDGGEEDAAAAAQAALPAPSVSFIGSAQNAYVKHGVKLRTRRAPFAAVAHTAALHVRSRLRFAARARSRSYREAAGTVLLSGGRILEELSGAADDEAGGESATRPPLLARVLLLAPGAPPPRGVRAERTLTASPDVLRKVRCSAFCACCVCLERDACLAFLDGWRRERRLSGRGG